MKTLKPMFTRLCDGLSRRIRGAAFQTGLLIAVSVMLLGACAQEGLPDPITAPPETIPSDTGQENGGDAQGSGTPEAQEEDDTLPPRAGMLRSRLTNEWVDADVANTRPIAVMTPVEKAAMPHYSLSEASILYEANVEGRYTRLLAIYEDWQNLEKIGNVRSLRLYYGFWALEWDAFLVHFGGPFFVDDLLNQPTTQNINGNSGTDTDAFFRTSDRKAPHNAYASGQGLLKVINQKGYSLSYRGLADEEHYRFTPKAVPNTLEQYSNAVTARNIDMSSCYPLTRCTFEYRPEDGLYYRSQHLSGSEEGPHIDAVTGKQLAFKNILVQYTKYEDLGKGYLAFQCHDTTRDGWYFTNGKGIHVKWKKTSDYSATRYYDDSGNEIVLNTGKTMVLIVEEGDSFAYE
ncbi:MAG: DUF3048 domain-containing protein [Clostridium sp.]|jgi:hypothetical protein|nr:DUF3048 domain-containing protein [Clostridium sp.]